MTAFTAIFIVTTDLSAREHRVCKAVDNAEWTRRFKRMFAISVQRAMRRYWFLTRRKFRAKFKVMTNVEWNGELSDEDMFGKRLLALKYRFSSREWVPGLSAIIVKSMYYATGQMRISRHVRPEEVRRRPSPLRLHQQERAFPFQSLCACDYAHAAASRGPSSRCSRPASSHPGRLANDGALLFADVRRLRDSR